ncbi:unnamed protein product [Coffea canephora]|uniref:DC1 domain-containing protein n=1 Tax=Coffea canephora TaxID=49390 RepID=A0A068UHH7_COFCA|nr:unnamed protein product [Coffea canephora]
MKNDSFNHFGHEHLLTPLVLDEGDKLYCKACELQIIEPFHGCLSCNYYLHDKCLNIPRSILHPSHSDHPLTLLPFPTYPTSTFKCNACGSNGNGFSYSCAHCEFDIHIQCASLPRKVKHLEKHHHELKLTYKFVQDKNLIFECDECGKTVDVDQWRYYCAECDFGTHLVCVEINEPWMEPWMDGDPVLDGKSGTAQAVQPSETVDGQGENGVEELRKEMMQHQLAVARLQNQLNLSASVAQLVKYL